MKIKSFFAAIVAVMLFAACENKQPAYTPEKVYMVTIPGQPYVDHQPLTKPLYNCDTRKPNGNKKLIGMNEIFRQGPNQTLYFVVRNGVPVWLPNYCDPCGLATPISYGPCDPCPPVYQFPTPMPPGQNYPGYDNPGIVLPEQKALPVVYNPLSGDDWFSKLLWFLFAAILIGMVLFLLHWMWQHRAHRNPQDPGPTNPPKGNQNGAPASTSGFNEEAGDHVSMMLNNLQATGGKIKVKMGDFVYEMETPLVEEETIIFFMESDKETKEEEKKAE